MKKPRLLTKIPRNTDDTEKNPDLVEKNQLWQHCPLHTKQTASAPAIGADISQVLDGNSRIPTSKKLYLYLVSAIPYRLRM